MQEGETIRQTAERVLGETVNVEQVQPYFVGNAPAGHVEMEEGTLFFNRWGGRSVSFGGFTGIPWATGIRIVWRLRRPTSPSIRGQEFSSLSRFVSSDFAKLDHRSAAKGAAAPTLSSTHSVRPSQKARECVPKRAACLTNSHPEQPTRKCRSHCMCVLRALCRCQLIQGKPTLRPGSGYSDYAWVAKDELGEYIKHKPTLELLQKML